MDKLKQILVVIALVSNVVIQIANICLQIAADNNFGPAKTWERQIYKGQQ